MAWLEDHLDETIARYAAEDGCTVEEWKRRAVYATASQRYAMEPHSHPDVAAENERLRALLTAVEAKVRLAMTDCGTGTFTHHRLREIVGWQGSVGMLPLGQEGVRSDGDD